MPKAVLSFAELESALAGLEDYHPKGPFPLFIKDLIEDTVGWSDSARWRYLRVLEHMFHQGGYIPNDPIYIAEIIGVKGIRKWELKVNQVREKLTKSEFKPDSNPTQTRFKRFESDLRNGFLTNKHILRDVIKAFRRSEIGRIGGETKAANRLPLADLKGTDGTIPVEPPSPIVEEEGVSPKKSIPLSDPPFKKDSKKVKKVKKEPLRINGEKLTGIWNQVLGGILPTVSGLSSGRTKKLKARMRENFAGEVIQWRTYCERIKASAFLRGETGRDSWKGATFDWAICPTNVRKVMEGNYDDKSTDDQPLTDYEQALAKWFGDGEPPDERPNPENYR